MREHVIAWKQAAKATILPRGGYPRRIQLGIGRGIRMRIDFAHQTRTYLGLYEVELNRYLRRMLKSGMTAFDVGGQNGYDALVVARITRGPVASFECDGACVAEMRRNFALNGALGRQIEPVQAMVGDRDGELSLDEWAFVRGMVPDFIKIDIDGGELGALRSAERILQERRPGVIVETHSVELERACGELLRRHGYRVRIVNQRGLWPDRRPTEHNRWLVAS